MVCVAACVGGDDTSNPDSGAPDTGSDTTTSDVANDTGCTPSCVDVNTLSACPTQQVACALGCSTSGGAHCQVLQPQSPVTAADLSTAGVSALTISTNAFINTDTGVIDIPTVSTIRAANADPSTFQIISGIGYQLFAGVNVGVFTVGNFTINDTITLTARGNAAFALASSGTIVITGVLDARGYTSAGMLCGDVTGGPGGGVGSATGNAPGTGGGQGGDSDLTGADQTVSGGGGGGGYGGVGGVGGNGLSGYGTGGGTGGIVASLLPTIAGGFGGGDSVLGKGGGGGGGVQLVAATSITVGGGSMTGGINAGGCSSVLTNGYGGGGSGGTILLETPVVTMQTMGVLGANGGIELPSGATVEHIIERGRKWVGRDGSQRRGRADQQHEPPWRKWLWWWWWGGTYSHREQDGLVLAGRRRNCDPRPFDVSRGRRRREFSVAVYSALTSAAGFAFLAFFFGFSSVSSAAPSTSSRAAIGAPSPRREPNLMMRV